jgi:hypothetical protein
VCLPPVHRHICKCQGTPERVKYGGRTLPSNGMTNTPKGNKLVIIYHWFDIFLCLTAVNAIVGLSTLITRYTTCYNVYIFCNSVMSVPSKEICA